MKSNKHGKKNRFFTFIGLLWGFIIVNSIFYVISIHDYNDKFYQDAESIARYIITEDYAYFSDMVETVRGKGLSLETDPEYKELVALSDYFNAGWQKKLYTEAGLSANADYYEKKMIEARKDLEKLDFVADSIDSRLQDKLAR